MPPPPHRAGNLPDLRPAAAPIELPRVVMRGALAVAAVGVLLALLLGMWRARTDMREETGGALVLAQAMAQLARAGERTPAALLAELQALSLERQARHLRLQVLDALGRPMLAPAAAVAESPPLAWLVALSRRVFPPPPARTLSWPLALPDGGRWTVELTASPDSEQHEALAQLAELLGLLVGGSALLLAVLHWNVRRSFRPLRPLLDAIASVERQDLAPLRALPAMPIRELDAIAAALRHLAGALEQAETSRRLLSRQVMTLQEDERHRLARELHDELGQQLTALRVDAAWLARRLAEQPELATVVAGMGAQCERIQQELRALLTRLRPLGAAMDGEVESVARLRSLLESLVAAWGQSAGRPMRCTLIFEPGPVPADAVLPRELVLTVYRISQEALTNVARHAQARRAVLSVRFESARDATLLDWSVEDDGIGLPDTAAWQRGNGLAGVKERVWAAGGDLQSEPVHAEGSPTPGLRLRARLPVPPTPAEETPP
ncbi:MAG TPA: histidine kinase [Methylibium sp.]|nr:histidine kinase [Methylibium sp.]